MIERSSELPLSDFMEVSRDDPRIVENMTAWMRYQIEKLVAGGLTMKPEEFAQFLSRGDAAVFTAVVNCEEHHDAGPRLSDDEWNKFCRRAGGRTFIQQRVEGYLVGRKVNGRMVSSVPHDYLRMKIEKHPSYPTRIIPPAFNIRDVIVSHTADPGAIRRLLLDHAKMKHEAGEIDYIYSAVKAGDPLWDALQDEEFNVLQKSFPEGDRYWLVWPPKSWNKRWFRREPR